MIVLPSTARGALRLVAAVALLGSGWWWWGIQSQLTDNTMIAVAFSIILVIAPPSLTAFLVPWTSAGMLLQKINGRTWGFMAVIACALYYGWYLWYIATSWWSAQPVASDTGLVQQQVWVAIIGFIIIPALVWVPVGDEELRETLRQDHLIRRTKLMTEADLNIRRHKLLRAQQMALVGVAQLTADEYTELGETTRSLLGEINGTLQQLNIGTEGSRRAIERFDLDDAKDVVGILSYQQEMLTTGPLAVYTPPRKALPAPEAIDGDDVMAERLRAHTTPAYTPQRRARRSQL